MFYYCLLTSSHVPPLQFLIFTLPSPIQDFTLPNLLKPLVLPNLSFEFIPLHLPFLGPFLQSQPLTLLKFESLFFFLYFLSKRFSDGSKEKFVCSRKNRLIHRRQSQNHRRWRPSWIRKFIYLPIDITIHKIDAK